MRHWRDVGLAVRQQGAVHVGDVGAVAAACAKVLHLLGKVFGVLGRQVRRQRVGGIVVAGVMRDGPAHRAGIEPGDVILAIDGRKIAEPQQALLIISSRKPGSRVQLDIMRQGKRMTLAATAIERPARLTPAKR